MPRSIPEGDARTGWGQLERQLFWKTMLLMLLLASASAIMEFYIVLSGRAVSHEDAIRKILQAMDANIDRAIWEVNSGTLDSIAKSLSSRPEVRSVRIAAGSLQITVPDTVLPDGNTQRNCSSTVSQDYKDHVPFRESLTAGRIDICLQNIPLSNAELRSVFSSILSRIVSIVISALGVLVIFQGIVLRRLSSMTARLQAADLFTPVEQALAKDEANDELGILYYELVKRTQGLETAQGILEAAIETISAGIVVTDDALTIERVNASFNVLMGGDAEYRIGDKLERDEPLLQKCLANLGTPVIFEHPNGLILEAIARRMKPSGYLFAVRDQTEKHRAYQRSAISQKTEAIGRLASSIAHDFNNVLAIIQGNAQIGLRQTSLPQGILKRFTSIDEAAKTGAALTQRLRSFTHSDARLAITVLPEAAIQKVVGFFGLTLGSGISFEFQCLSKRTIECEREFLDAALLNLTINAIDAIKESGRKGHISITATDVTEDGMDFVAFLVADNGGGIPPGILTKVIDPFFTTKEHGTGLGLATVSGFAAQSGGKLKISSTHGEGTQITLLLPAKGWVEGAGLAAANEATEGSAGHALQSPESTRGSILIVDDDLRVGEVIADMLGQIGFSTQLVVDLEAAVAACAATKFVAVVCDVVLAGCYGTDVYRAITPQTSVPFIFISGNAEGSIRAEISRLSGSLLLDKPVQFVQLSEVIERLLKPPRAA